MLFFYPYRHIIFGKIARAVCFSSKNQLIKYTLGKRKIDAPILLSYEQLPECRCCPINYSFNRQIVAIQHQQSSVHDKFHQKDNNQSSDELSDQIIMSMALVVVVCVHCLPMEVFLRLLTAS